MVSEEKIFRNRPIRNNNCLWWPCLSMDQDKMSKLHRGPSIDASIDASYQVSVHLAKGFQRRRFFRKQPIRNKNCLWQPCLLTDRNEMSILYRGPSIEACYQVSAHLARGFQRKRLKSEKLTDDRRRMMDAKWWQKLMLPLARWANKKCDNRTQMPCPCLPER